MIYDSFIFNDELDILEARFNYLYDIVDRFVLTEVDTTFSGRPKTFVFLENSQRFAKFKDKIIYNQVFYADICNRTANSGAGYTDFTKSIAHKHGGRFPSSLHDTHITEILQRDSVMDALNKHCTDDDLILVSDVDEIPSEAAIRRFEELSKQSRNMCFYFEQEWFLYWINYRVLSPWYGTVGLSFASLKASSVDTVRYASSRSDGVPGFVIDGGGWHFSYMGGHKVIKKKLNDLCYQGLRAEVSKFLANYLPFYLQIRLYLGHDLLNQGRRFEKVQNLSFRKSNFPVPFLEKNVLR